MSETLSHKSSVESKSEAPSVATATASATVGSSFYLPKEFLEEMIKLKPKMGFNGLGEFVYYRTYSRIKPDGNKECWQDTLQRVVEGCYTTQKQHILSIGKEWDESKAQRSAQEMFRRLFAMKFLPGGRGLFAQNTKIITEKKLSAALYNCAAISTKDMDKNPTETFEFFMDMLCLGAGVGFDSMGAGKLTILARGGIATAETFLIPDSREGWVEALKKFLESYFVPGAVRPNLDYSAIRPAGEPLKTFGGTSCGSGPLQEMFTTLEKVLDPAAGKLISTRIINDIFCIIAKAVVSGNIRRSSSISIGDVTDEEFINLKDYKVNSYREGWGWNSNNSVKITNDDIENGKIDYEKISKQIANTGEPGIFFIDNARAYSRMNGSLPDWDDRDISLTNPCAEVVLNSGELCNLVECFISKAVDFEDFKTTLKYAFLYAKSVTLLPVHWEKSKEIMDKNRRIGTSLTGITDFIAMKNDQGIDGTQELKNWMNQGYLYLKELDQKYSKWFEIPRSIKITTIKPSGTISLLAGCAPGCHFNMSQYYIRRVRISNTDPLLKLLESCGYRTEVCFGNEMTTSCVEIPVDCGQQYNLKDLKTIKQATIWDQYELTRLAQENWADNSVSSTITFKPHEVKEIINVIKAAKTQLKCVSFLPSFDDASTPYRQMPYEAISRETFLARSAELKEVDYSKINISAKDESKDAVGDKYCNNDVCQI